MSSEFRISATYILTALVWILFSDRLLEIITGPNIALLGTLQSFKGIFFVLATGAGLYMALRRVFRARDDFENRLRSSEEKFRYLFIHNPLPMWVYDLETLAFLDVNNTAVYQYGYARAEFLAMRITDIRPPETLERLEQQLHEARPALQYSGEWQHRYKNGLVVDVEIISHRLEFAGRPAALVVANNITERKAVEKQLREQEKLHVALKKDNELREMRNRFISMLSHEFRNPLAGIRMTNDVRYRYNGRLDGAKQQELHQRIEEEVPQLERMVEDILALLRSESTNGDFNPQRLNLEQLCRAILQQHMADRDNIRAEVQSDPPSLTVDADEKLMRYAIGNLIANAVKYSPDGGCIMVMLTQNSDHVLLRVQDEGIGIPAENLLRVFEPFFRGRNVGQITGTGLGLAIARQSVERHGGTLTVESEEGSGTAFTISLPHTQGV